MCFGQYILPSLLTIVALVNVVVVDVAIVSYFGSSPLLALVGIVNIVIADAAIIIFFYLLLLLFAISCSCSRGNCI